MNMKNKIVFVKSLCAQFLLCVACIVSNAQAVQTAADYQYAKRYDLTGQVTGEIKPQSKPGAKFPAVRNTYEGGLLVKVEAGALGSFPDENVKPKDWAGFEVITTKIIHYDEFNRKSDETTQGTGGDVTEYAYDVYSRVTCVAKRLSGGVTGNACTGNTSSVNADRITKYFYENTFGKATDELRAVGTVDQQTYVHNSYGTNGLLTDQKDANGNLTHLTYDSFARLEYMYFPDKVTVGSYSTTDFEKYGYDLNGNRTSLKKRDGRTINYSYDALNRVTFKDVPPDPITLDQTTAYDLLNLKTSDTFANGKGITTKFDGFGELVDETNNVSGTSYTVHNTYDKHGNRDAMTYEAKTINYTYNTLDQPEDIIDGAALLVHNSVDRFARPEIQSTMGGKTATQLTYDDASGAGRIATIDRTVADTAYNISYGFAYNNVGQIINQTYSNDLYDYKEKGSKVGNYAVNGLNQYTSVGADAYGYDKNGNLICDKGYVEATNSCSGNTYTYDVENRLVNATGIISATLSYDPSGRLYQITTGSESTYFMYSGDSMIGEYKNGELKKRHIFGVGVDKPLISYTVNQTVPTNDYRQFLMSNHQGSVVGATNSIGEILYVNTYDAYGVPGAANQGRFAYTGQTYLAELGMYYYKARIYAPRIGRFLQTDPIGYKDDYDLYSYVGNDPVNKADPTGKTIVLDKNLTADQQAMIKNSLKDMIKTDAGLKTFNELNGSSHKFAITSGQGRNGFGVADMSGAKTSGVGSGGTININPGTNGSVIDSKGGTSRPESVAMAHEMGHALDANRGEYIQGHRVRATPGTTPDFERTSVKTEDAVRAGLGIPLRESYFPSESAQKAACGGRLCEGANEMVSP